MQTVSCEHVFEILTRAPFSADDECDASVERHLVDCHECRCLAESIRPAVDLFTEAMADCDQAELPSYRGVVKEWAPPKVRTRDTTLFPPAMRAVSTDGLPINDRRVAHRGLLVGTLVALLIVMFTLASGSSSGWRFQENFQAIAAADTSSTQLADCPLPGWQLAADCTTQLRRALTRPVAKRTTEMTAESVDDRANDPRQPATEQAVGRNVKQCSKCHVMKTSGDFGAADLCCTSCHVAQPKGAVERNLFDVHGGVKMNRLTNACKACHR